MQVTLQLALKPIWEEIDLLADKCNDFLEREGLDVDARNALSMVACELAENATKYGHFNDSKESVKVSLAIMRTHVTVTVANPVTPQEAETLAILDHTIQWIRGFQDPFEAYVERMKVVSAQPYAQGQSGLGLTRIAYEGRCSLDFYVDESNTLAVSAVYRR